MLLSSSYKFYRNQLSSHWEQNTCKLWLAMTEAHWGTLLEILTLVGASWYLIISIMTRRTRTTTRKPSCMDEREATYRSEDASNFLNFMTVMINIPYILSNISRGLSVLSISLCTALVFCVIVYTSMLYTIALSTRAMLKILWKCDILEEAMQALVHHQHGSLC